MEVTELQNVLIYRVRDDKFSEHMIILMEDGELQFYSEIDLKYSYFEKALAEEKKKK